MLGFELIMCTSVCSWRIYWSRRFKPLEAFSSQPEWPAVEPFRMAQPKYAPFRKIWKIHEIPKPRSKRMSTVCANSVEASLTMVGQANSVQHVRSAHRSCRRANEARQSQIPTSKTTDNVHFGTT
jgi:hypothetical protein